MGLPVPFLEAERPKTAAVAVVQVLLGHLLRVDSRSAFLQALVSSIMPMTLTWVFVVFLLCCLLQSCPSPDLRVVANSSKKLALNKCFRSS